MHYLVVWCLWFGCPDPPPPADIAEVRSESIVSTTVAPDTYRGMGSDVEQWRGLVSGYFSNVDKALCVVKYESGGNPDARNQKSGAAGLFQVMPSVWSKVYSGDLYDPEYNTYVASEILKVQGWGAWSVVNKGLC